MKKISILITSAGSAPAISVIKALKKQNELSMNIIAVDMDELSAGFQLADKYYIVPSSGEGDFIPRVSDICKKEDISIVIPIIDEELPVFAKEKRAFNDLGIKMLANDLEVVNQARDKWKTYQFCQESKILAPFTCRANTLKPDENPGFKSSVVFKPCCGRGSQGVHITTDQQAFRKMPFNSDEFIAQDFIKGPEFTVDIVAHPTTGEILQTIPRERIMVKAGMVYKGRTVKNKKLMERAKIIAEKFGINGPCNIQFIEKDNKFYLIEINPKFAAGLPLTVTAGVNIPLILIKIHLGLKINPNEFEFKDNFYMLRYWEEVYLQR